MGVGAIDASLCLRGLQEAGTLACATRGTDGSPRVRYLSALHFELDAVYLLASRGMPFAQQLLADPRLKIGDIGEMVGYADTAHFARVFKKITGMSANEYRNSL